VRSPLVVYCAVTAATSRIAVLLCLVHHYAFKADAPTYHVEPHTHSLSAVLAQLRSLRWQVDGSLDMAGIAE
jgi:hypothetical protein